MLSTLGIAGVYAPVSAIRKYICPDCHPMRDVKQAWAWLCMTGVFAAESAKRGLCMVQKGNILDEPSGFWVMAGVDGFNETELTANLGVRYNILTATTKSHCGGANTHSPMDAVNWLVKENNLKPDVIERVDVSVDGLYSLGSTVQQPGGLVDAEFSVPYQVAASLSPGQEGPGWYSDEALQNPEILKLAKKVNVINNEDCTVALLKGSFMTKVKICTKSGKEYKKSVSLKVLSNRDEFRRKFRQLAQQVIGQRRAKAILNAVYELDKAENLKGLLRHLHPI